ncbi:unnamed protein product [Arabidopsis halleri]
MAKEMVTLAFIFAIVFSAFSPTIAEIVEKRNFKPLSDGEIVWATNEDEQAPARRYGPWIRQLIFAFTGNTICNQWNSGVSCANCDRYCKQAYPWPNAYGRCEGFIYKTCHCYYDCPY